MEKSTRREFAFQCGGTAAAITLGQALGAREARAATSQLQVSIDIMGLNALVHDRAARKAEVLFVNPVRLGMPRHVPFLVANLSDVTNPPSDSKPTTVTAVPIATGGGVQQVGLWDLTDTQVVVRGAGGMEVTHGLSVNARSDDGEVSPPSDPEDPEAWRDLRYVADMRRICGQGNIAAGLSSLDPSSGTADQKLVPDVVAGRVRLAGGVLEGAIPSWEEHRRAMYQFLRADGRLALSQPLTDTIRWRSSVDTAASGNYLTLDLVPLRGEKTGRTRTLMLSQQGRVSRLAITNLPTENPGAVAHHAMSDDEMAALHFGAYYKLLMNEPAEAPLPRISAVATRRGAGFMHTTFCPPARFTRD